MAKWSSCAVWKLIIAEFLLKETWIKYEIQGEWTMWWTSVFEIHSYLSLSSIPLFPLSLPFSLSSSALIKLTEFLLYTKHFISYWSWIVSHYSTSIFFFSFKIALANSEFVHNVDVKLKHGWWMNEFIFLIVHFIHLSSFFDVHFSFRFLY